MMRWIGLAGVLGLLVSASPEAWGPQEKEYDLTWKLPHDRAAVYEVWDAGTKQRRGEFWLLGCELAGRVGVHDGSDLPLRFLFRLPPQKVKVGSKWELREFAFAEPIDDRLDVSVTMFGKGMDPVEIVGVCRVKEKKPLKIDEFLKAIPRGKNERMISFEAAIIEGQFEVYRCRKESGSWVATEKRPSASFTTTVAARLDDGAIVGARYSWHGRMETYKDILGTAVGKSDETVEVIFREPLIGLSVKELKNLIDKAVTGGAKWLASRQDKEGKIFAPRSDIVGTFAGMGPTALALMALLHSGVSASDPVIKTGFAYLLKKELQQAYDGGTLLMALETKYLPFEKIEDILAYTEDRAREELAKQLSKEDKLVAERTAKWIIEAQASDGAFGYGNDRLETNLSNSQYAILGLKSASRMGIAIPTSVWKRAFGYVDSHAVGAGKEVTLAIERRDGKAEERKTEQCGWKYRPPRFPEITGTMTAAALVIAAICRSELVRAGEWTDPLAKRYEQLERGGLAWLQEHYSLRGGSPEGCWSLASMPFFYLYSFERAGILLELTKIGGHDWYLEGAAVLLSWQRADGRWESSHQVQLLDTSFALLFLKKAILPVATPSTGDK